MKTIQVEKTVIKFKHITSLKGRELYLVHKPGFIPQPDPGEGQHPAGRQGSQRPENHVAQPPALPPASSSTEATQAPTSTASQSAPPLLLKAANH